MELTLENLVFFIKKEIREEKEILSKDRLMEDLNIDGDNAVNLLHYLENEFNVSFKDFDFKKHFLEEWELRRLSIKKYLINEPKQRKIEELTVRELYNYMLKHKSNFMELTLENLISFIKKEIYEEDEISPQNTLLTDLGIDGDDAVELLINLQKSFNVSFESFNFNNYFCGEGFSLFSFSTIFKVKQKSTRL